MRRVLLLGMAALLSGCMVGPSYRTAPALPSAALKLREAEAANVAPSPLPPRWWRLFDDPDLDIPWPLPITLMSDRDKAASPLALATARLR